MVSDYSLDILGSYKDFRDFPALDKTSYLSVHLRFGTVSIREIVKLIVGSDSVFLSELIWREFFMQILWHFPCVETGSGNEPKRAPAPSVSAYIDILNMNFFLKNIENYLVK